MHMLDTADTDHKLTVEACSVRCYLTGDFPQLSIWQRLLCLHMYTEALAAQLQLDVLVLSDEVAL
eukprot:355301-Chlamydomonas_euryale.AAC.2